MWLRLERVTFGFTFIRRLAILFSWRLLPPQETHSRQGAWAFMHMRFQVPLDSRLSAFFLGPLFLFIFYSLSCDDELAQLKQIETVWSLSDQEFMLQSQLNAALY